MRGAVVLGVSGGIAAFRAVEVLRSLVKAGCDVTPILTRNAARFVAPRTFAVLAHRPAQVSLWSSSDAPGVDHIDLARDADCLVIAPATANVVAKMAAGIADDALTTYALAHRGALVVAPAMNTFMLCHQATQAALATLRARGARIVAPAHGELACGEVGEGKLAATDEIVAAVLAALPPRGPLAGLSVLVSAGPTREAIDAVRVITNRSSGAMGVALALAARDLGAHPTVLAGPGVAVPIGIPTVRFETAADLGRAMAEHAPGADVLFHAAAVADFRPHAPLAGKLDRRGGGLTLELEPVPDLARTLLRAAGRPYLAIFAAEAAAELEARAARKLAEKGADAVVANPIDEPGLGMEQDRNRAVLLTSSGLRREFPPQEKASLARDVLLALAPALLRAAAR